MVLSESGKHPVWKEMGGTARKEVSNKNQGQEEGFPGTSPPSGPPALNVVAYDQNHTDTPWNPQRKWASAPPRKGQWSSCGEMRVPTCYHPLHVIHPAIANASWKAHAWAKRSCGRLFKEWLKHLGSPEKMNLNMGGLPSAFLQTKVQTGTARLKSKRS